MFQILYHLMPVARGDPPAGAPFDRHFRRAGAGANSASAAIRRLGCCSTSWPYTKQWLVLLPPALPHPLMLRSLSTLFLRKLIASISYARQVTEALFTAHPSISAPPVATTASADQSGAQTAGAVNNLAGGARA